MRRIIKRILRTDHHGNVHGRQDEIVIQTDTGDIGLFRVETLESSRCHSCGRRVSLPDLARCSVCSRAVCRRPSCRTGLVVGPDKLLVCRFCLPEARRSAQLAEVLALERAKAQLLQSSLLDHWPGTGIVRQLAEMQILRKLKRLENKEK